MEMPMSKIEIYTRPGCGYCTHAKRLLLSNKLKYIEYDVYQESSHIKELHKRTGGRSYPQVFIDGQSIGGFTDLLILEQSGKLAQKTTSQSGE